MLTQLKHSTTLCIVLIITGCAANTAEQNSPPQATIFRNEPVVNQEVLWQYYGNKAYGFSFMYQADLALETQETNNPITGILFAVSSYFAKYGDNNIYITVNSKEGSEAYSDTNLDSRIKNTTDVLHVNSTINIPNGTIYVQDGIGTADHYFITGYLKGKNYNYVFQLSRPNYSKEVVNMFTELLESVRLQ